MVTAAAERLFVAAAVVGVVMLAGKAVGILDAGGQVWWAGTGVWLLLFAAAVYRVDADRWAAIERNEQ